MSTGIATIGPQQFSMADIKAMAKEVVASRLCPGIKTEQEAFTLMLLCQSEGLHPMTAMRRFHVFQGRPTMRADAMQAEYQRLGGLIRDVEITNTGASARFVHPIQAPEPGVYVSFTEEDAVAAGVFASNPNYKKWPGSMYWARVVGFGVRRVLPGVIVGIYSSEEAEDMSYANMPAASTQVFASRSDALLDKLTPKALEIPIEVTEAPVVESFGQWIDAATADVNLRWADELAAANTDAGEDRILVKKEQTIQHLAKAALDADFVHQPQDGKRTMGWARKVMIDVWSEDSQWIEHETAKYFDAKAVEARGRVMACRSTA